jgi:nicotinamidase-related amidase
MAKLALCILDIQGGILSLMGDIAAAAYLSNLTPIVTSARTKGIPIIHITTAFRTNHPELAATSQFASIAKTNAYEIGSPSTAIPAAILDPSDIQIVKKRVSGFAGNDLEIVLRGLKIETLVIAGVATSGAVLSTVRQAKDLDFGLILLRDLCWDKDEEVQRVLMEKVFPRQADVVEAGSWVAGL